MTDEPGPGDRFRAFDEILKPDPRRAYWVVEDEKTGELRPYTLREFHGALDTLSLDRCVPVAVRVQFDNALNLLLHSYFVYRFVQVAELQALRTLEFALREALGVYDRSRPTLKPLIERAIREGRVNADEIVATVSGRRGEPCRAGITTIRRPSEADRSVAAYLESLAEGLGQYRNILAHGGLLLAPGGFHVLAICRTMINQLFGAPATLEASGP